ncbi:response regulator transcription factor [Priestia megaterium]
MNEIKIVLLDSHQMFATGLKELLSKEKNLRIMDCFYNTKELENSISQNNPDIIIMEAKIEYNNGFNLLACITRSFPHIKVIMLAEQIYCEYIELAYEYGASALLETKKSVNSLINCINQVSEGYRLLPSFNDFHKNKFLTSQERIILNLISEDRKNKEISQILSVSSRTVENHVSSILRKLDASSRVGAVVEGIKRGLIAI